MSAAVTNKKRVQQCYQLAKKALGTQDLDKLTEMVNKIRQLDSVLKQLNAVEVEAFWRWEIMCWGHQKHQAARKEIQRIS